MSRIATKILWISFAVIFGAGVRAQVPEWSQFVSSPPGNSPRNDDIHFVDSLHGWAARATDGIFRTTNGGLTFVEVRPSVIPYPGTNLLAHFRSINFASTTRGWAGNLGPGSYDGSVTDTNLLYETLDGGETWSPVAAINNSDMKGFCAIQVLDAQHIYGAGRVRGPAHFAWSTNGGTNWSVTNLTAAGIMGGIMDVYFQDPLNGFLVGMDTNAFTPSCSGYRGTIARTTDGGLTWSNVVTTPVTCSYFWKMSWPSPTVGYVTLQQNDSAHETVVFYKTTDGGATWASNGIPIVSIGAASFGLQGIGFVSETEGWMGGSGSVGHPFNFIHTTDGGATWAVAGYSDTRSINRIRFLNSTFGYASGRKLHVFRIPLAIVTAPTNQTVAVGAPVTFAVTGQGMAPLTYQWRLNGANLAGATTNQFVIASAQLTNAGDYDVVVADYSGALTSALANLSVIVPESPTILSQPQSVDTYLGANVTFSLTATGTPPLNFRWQLNGTNFPAAMLGNDFQSTYHIASAQVTNVGAYTVIVSNLVGVVTSEVATLTLNKLFVDDFDGYGAPVSVTNPATTNGYKIFFNAASGPVDFTATFGFDYSTVTYPTNISPAPNSVGGTTKGLYLTVNKKDAIAAAAAVNLYPTNLTFSGNFALKFDLWLNWANGATSTEHVLFGINHSGNVTNRIGLATSDGLFFAVAADGGVTATSTDLRDFAVFRGGGAGAIPVLMLTNNTTFGPTPPLGPRFDGSDPGFAALFPPKTIAGWTTTLPGVAGVAWIEVELRQVNNLVTCLLNGTAIAQYTNTYAFPNGTLLIGYNDRFNSIGDLGSFAIIDNLRVERIQVAPPLLLTPTRNGNDFRFGFVTQPYESYTVQTATNLVTPTWLTVTNMVGDGLPATINVPWSAGAAAPQYFRVSRP